MLNINDIVQIDNSIATAYQSTHVTPSGPFLDILRNFAKGGRIQDMAEAMQYYFKREPTRRDFILERLSDIIDKSYFSTLPNFDMSKFAGWQNKNLNWARDILQSLNQPTRFEAEVNKVAYESQK